jgi:hypothetical protein
VTLAAEARRSRAKREQLESFVRCQPAKHGDEFGSFRSLSFLWADVNCFKKRNLTDFLNEIVRYQWRITPWFDFLRYSRKNRVMAHVPPNSIDN